jgi:pimeloyl-[acyl-carrier protein] methyl ester esterase
MPWYENRNGERLWYEDKGAGYPVLLLHGWCMSSAVWKYQFDALSDSLRIIAPDLRGHGRSRAIFTDLTFSGFANDLIDLFAELNLSQVLLVGWSMGAQIAMQACADLSNKLAGLLLVSATPSFTASDDFPHAVADNEARGMRLKVQRDTGKALEGFYSRIFAEGELEGNPLASDIKSLLSSITPPDTTVALHSLDALAKADMRDILSAISIPALILNGALDQICFPQASNYLAEHIPGAEHTVFQIAGHAPFLTNPLRFNAELLKFSRSVCEQHT